MNVQFATAESAFCPKLKTREGHVSHIAQPHLPITSLPGPSERLEIAHFPVKVRSETSAFRPKEISNLWLQLLVIQVQNGNLWNYDDILQLHGQKIIEKRPAISRGEIPMKPTILNDSTSDPKLVDGKTAMFLRHKLQKGFLSRDKVPTETEMVELSSFIRKLEDALGLEPRVIQACRIHKVLVAICKLETIPGDEEFNIRVRCQELIEKWDALLETYTPDAKAARAAMLAEQANSAPQQPVTEPAETAPVVVDAGDQMPPVCITQRTTDECANIEAISQACDPPLDRAVIELMCMLPQFSSKLEREGYQIGPLARIHDTPEGLQRGADSERKYEGWGAMIPPHVLQLTEFSQEGYGTALYVDTKTGEGIVFNEYRVTDPDIRDVKWEHLIGDKTPIEELLQKWIQSFLKGTFMPAGKGAVFEEGPRCISHRRMDFLRHKALLLEFGWPATFPLQAPQYHEFLCRQRDLHRTTFDKNPRHTVSLSRKWQHVTGECYFRNNFVSHEKDIHQRELFSTLDRRVKETLNRHECRVEERQYALAADVPMLQDLIRPISLYGSANIGDGWRVDVTPEMILERFEEVFAKSPQAKDADTDKMREILKRAYERQKLESQGIYEGEYWSEEDDDSTSDYDPEAEEMGEDEKNNDEDYESDEDMEDLDAGILKADMEDDIEIVRVELQGYRIE